MSKPAISLKARALRYLSMREHSRLELSRKLQRHAQESDDVDGLLDWLESAHFLSQQRFSESLVHRRSARFGNNRIVLELQSHGIKAEELSHAKIALQRDESQRAVAVLLKKFPDVAIDAAGRAKQIRFLQQRGFSHDAVRSALQAASAAQGKRAGPGFNEEEIDGVDNSQDARNDVDGQCAGFDDAFIDPE